MSPIFHGSVIAFNIPIISNLFPFILLVNSNCWVTDDRKRTEILSIIDKLPEDEKSKDVTMSVLVELAARLRGKDVCLVYLQNRIQFLMKRWDATCYPPMQTTANERDNRPKRPRCNVNIVSTQAGIRAQRRKQHPGGWMKDPRNVAPDVPFYLMGKVQFNEDEDFALLEGFTKFGTKWCEIKFSSPVALRNRTPENLKDRIRTMQKKGLIVEHANVNFTGESWYNQSDGGFDDDSD